ncbi:NAD(+) diphosphatase [Acuticoccus sediminis]|uniref:NAD(+) diphosphatase n=1 Tax=Acuticoccus sediminis TaxID=2184697 RepID=A0A8B2NWS1_9HYPH|nr:NAD(+) diphosphatase [Acuticoccus sediminis]RAI03120.1 NAD(+) diphosphatase [Acuticoccus sediminis]
MTLSYPLVDVSAQMAFGVNRLDRMSERRDDALLLSSLRRDPQARAFLYAGAQIVTKDGGFLFSKSEAEALGADWATTTFLGQSEDGPLFGASIPEADGLETKSLRSVALEAELPLDLLGPAAQASALLVWHRTHEFCGRCGHRTTLGEAGYRRECPNCGAQHFPRTDPVVIMLAIDGERCVLGRRANMSFYSSLAGFMEPGETIEAAVRREIWEEAGVATGRVVYHASQPWPFPANLMIGCFAEATSFEIDPRDKELEDVRWFDRKDLPSMLEGRNPPLAVPGAYSIAHYLIKTYAERGSEVLVNGR